MDVDIIPAPPLNCFICKGPETAAQKLAQVSPKGYTTLLTYAEKVENITILERMKEAWNVEQLRYHSECRHDFYNTSVKVTRKSTRKCDIFHLAGSDDLLNLNISFIVGAAEVERESAQMKRRRSASTPCSFTSSHSTQLLYNFFAFFATSLFILPKSSRLDNNLVHSNTFRSVYLYMMGSGVCKQ